MVSSTDEEHELLLSCISQVSTSGDDSIPPLSDKTDIPTYMTALTYRMIAIVVNNTFCKVHFVLFEFVGIMYSSSHSCGGDDTAVSDDGVGVLLGVVFDFMIVVYEERCRQNHMMNVEHFSPLIPFNR